MWKIVLLLLLLGSCSFEQWAKRGVKRGWYHTDTILDSLVIKEVRKDTIFNHFATRDTVFLKENKLTVKYFYNTKDSTVFISGKCESDTIRIERVINTITEAKDSSKWIYLAIIAGLIVLIVVIKR